MFFFFFFPFAFAFFFFAFSFFFYFFYFHIGFIENWILLLFFLYRIIMVSEKHSNIWLMLSFTIIYFFYYIIK
jgi:hypothetical protein